jgi:uncharacterized protein (DUF427 family)
MSGKRVRALWNGLVLAESDATVVVEGNHYFPPHAVSTEHLVASCTSSSCPRKGAAVYWSVQADGQGEPDVAWTYLDPKPEAALIRGRIAFWKGVRVEEVGD